MRKADLEAILFNQIKEEIQQQITYFQNKWYTISLVPVYYSSFWRYSPSYILLELLEDYMEHKTYKRDRIN